ncbi:DUF4244 domain-containing protein [Arthrobacter sp.]|uniref:DUF4244 domain-containing protein n=1 Tax=Arthrobacter sp. TaxID=1667 RepID=UPI0026DF3E96|nr:DUF4244 domain-containing protein [Arthrobacter sp.]MDO5753398.1 DUF4244 domain-containing protein [Arthrobacter sp.]
MNSSEAVQEIKTGTHCATDTGNIREIFPGASRSTPVRNHGGRAQAGSRRSLGRRARVGMENGMATAEYAIATLAAVGFAGLLVVILKSDEVRGFLLNVIRTALSF